MKNLWRKVDTAMANKGIKRMDLIARLGLSKQGYYNMRNNPPENMKIGYIFKMADILGCSVSSLIIDNSESEGEQDPVSAKTLNMDLESLLKLTNYLMEELKEKKEEIKRLKNLIERK